MTIVVVLNLSNCELRPTRTKTVTAIKTGNDLDTRRKRRGGGGGDQRLPGDVQFIKKERKSDRYHGTKRENHSS